MSGTEILRTDNVVVLRGKTHLLSLEIHKQSLLDSMETLALGAMRAAENALPRRSNLQVGAAVLAGSDDTLFCGANFEVRWQGSYHAEELAILNALYAGRWEVRAICVSAERELFTPCGRCMDLIKEFGGRHCIIAHYRPSTKGLSIFTSEEVMPFYPATDGNNGG